MANNYDYVCFNDRRAARRPKWPDGQFPEPKCPDCEIEMISIGYKLRVPRHQDKSGWKALYSKACQYGYVKEKEGDGMTILNPRPWSFGA